MKRAYGCGNGWGLTATGAEGNHIREGTVSLAVSGLDLDEVRSVGREAFNSGRHLIANDTFDDPIAIPLGAIGRVEDDVASNLAVGLLGRLPIQVDGRWILLDRNDGEVARGRGRRRLERLIGHHQTPRTFFTILHKRDEGSLRDGDAQRCRSMSNDVAGFTLTTLTANSNWVLGFKSSSMQFNTVEFM